jgi:malonate-semialdehyde dehydrogenase (acetylating)/methylmalonate-semialdehyde dehydrogenase
MNTVPHWINGTRTEGTGPERLAVTDPATGATATEVVVASPADVDAAVAAAHAAFAGWSETSLSRRTSILFRFREYLDHHREELARLVSAEHGKVLDDALGEVSRGIDVVEYACGIASALRGDRTDNASGGVDVFNFRQPLGVVAGITPFNFPAMVPMWMFPVAIATGNTFILKPSEKDPSVSVRLAELFTDAGLPDGVFNVVQGDHVAVNALLDHESIAAVSFVGSTPVARHVHERAHASGKRVQALGGAKNHMVVMPDADIALAADAAVSAGYGSAGERCMAISVVVAVGDTADALIPAIRERVDGLRIGPGLSDEPMDMGALITDEHRNRVRGYVDAGVAEGASLEIDGRDLVVEGHEDGYWLGPCLFDGVTPEMSIYRDEIFGPVLGIVRVDSLDAALELVNANAFGNGTAIFTRNGAAARRYHRDVQVGMVGVNVPIPVPMAYYSFGGWKDSLFGEHHMHGDEGIRFYTRHKAVTTRWPEDTSGGVDLGFPGGAK